MRTSCNGCRVLRKGCGDNCALRPCLEWIKSAESQTYATLFLAKFYGRVGLLNLIDAGPNHLRPEIFRSLLYEACGRIVNPVHGSVGLLWSNNWDKCQSAVDAVLSGSHIMQSAPPNAADEASMHPIMSLNICDIRHQSKDPTRTGQSQTWGRHGIEGPGPVTQLETGLTRAPSHGLSSFLVETVEGSLMNGLWPGQGTKFDPEGEIGVELTLGCKPMTGPGV